MSYNKQDYPAFESKPCVCQDCGKGCKRTKNILVPTDMSQASKAMLQFAWYIALEINANLDVLYVMDSIFDGKYASSTGFLSGYQETLKRELDEFVAVQVERLSVRNEQDSAHEKVSVIPAVTPIVKTHIGYGFPEQIISQESNNYDLVIMGTAGKNSDVGDRLFGSVSTEVAKNTATPVIFIPPDVCFNGFRNMVYTSNMDSLDENAIHTAVELAHQFDSQLHFVHVGVAGEPDMEKQYRLFKGSFKHADHDHPFIFERIIEDANTVSALYDYAFTHRIDALIFTTHHRDFWESLFHKSISAKAIQTAGMPIIVLHKTLPVPLEP